MSSKLGFQWHLKLLVSILFMGSTIAIVTSAIPKEQNVLLGVVLFCMGFYASGCMLAKDVLEELVRHKREK